MGNRFLFGFAIVAGIAVLGCSSETADPSTKPEGTKVASPPPPPPAPATDSDTTQGDTTAAELDGTADSHLGHDFSKSTLGDADEAEGVDGKKLRKRITDQTLDSLPGEVNPR